ncbi:MAG: hypothetical protein OEV17_04625 [Nitrospira sp.]|nr:hypothetical protein [Nitrospira sp.]
MTALFQQFIESWLFDPTVGKLITTAATILIVIALVRILWAGLIQQYRVDPAELDPRVFLTANDNWMAFTLRYVVDYKKRRLTKDLLYTRTLEEIESTNGRVALASATFHLVDAPELKVKLVESTKGGGA